MRSFCGAHNSQSGRDLIGLLCLRCIAWSATIKCLDNVNLIANLLLFMADKIRISRCTAHSAVRPKGDSLCWGSPWRPAAEEFYANLKEWQSGRSLWEYSKYLQQQPLPRTLSSAVVRWCWWVLWSSSRIDRADSRCWLPQNLHLHFFSARPVMARRAIHWTLIWVTNSSAW